MPGHNGYPDLKRAHHVHDASSSAAQGEAFSTLCDVVGSRGKCFVNLLTPG
jgi:hypothetical protein